jgi:hypothetical protein
MAGPKARSFSFGVSQMPLQSRVDPFGRLFVGRNRGTLMGNRGGRLHDKNRKLGARRWVSRQWICCKLDFNNRQRNVWGDGYTELFFLDEPTAFAAGHRPCFECRREDAELFARLAGKLRAGEMDRLLHAQRVDGKEQRRHRFDVGTLPDGAFAVFEGRPYAVRGADLINWTAAGYGGARRRPRSGKAAVLTPPLMLKVLRAGYQPAWHPSASP